MNIYPKEVLISVTKTRILHIIKNMIIRTVIDKAKT